METASFRSVAHLADYALQWTETALHAKDTASTAQAVSTWLVTVSNAILAIGAIITSIFAIKAFRAQSRQLADQRRINSLQADEITASLSQRKRAQAAQVFIELRYDPPPSWVTVDRSPLNPDAIPWHYTAEVANSSAQPIYEVQLNWLTENEFEGRTATAQRIMPGQNVTFDCEIYLSAQPISPDAVSAVAKFRDAAGVSWALSPDGRLEDVTGSSTPKRSREQPSQESDLSADYRRSEPRDAQQVTPEATGS